MGVGVTAENVLKYVNVKVGTGIFWKNRIRCGSGAGSLECCACDVRVMCICRLF